MLNWGTEKWIKRSSASEHDGETEFALLVTATTKDKIYRFQALNIRHHRAVISEQGDRMNFRLLQLAALEILGCSSRRSPEIFHSGRKRDGNGEARATVHPRENYQKAESYIERTQRPTASPEVTNWALISTACVETPWDQGRIHPKGLERTNSRTSTRLKIF